MEPIPWTLGVIAALLIGIGYLIYNVQSKKKTSAPNAVSWFIWSLMAVLNASSFVGVTDIPHALHSMVGTFSAIVTFLLCLYWRSFDWPKLMEWVVLVFCLVTMWLLNSLKDASIANAIILFPFLISFWPTFNGVRKDPHKEKSLAWWIWTAAFAVNLINNILSWNGKPMSVINPIVLLICHGSIAYLAREARKQRFPLTS
ncbi:MAG TPA: hypothetical protein VJB64_03550 [Patescibacteria group bacterium]|nr:hypothetical protein [Patescibacteria group bacterium]